MHRKEKASSLAKGGEELGRITTRRHQGRSSKEDHGDDARAES